MTNPMSVRQAAITATKQGIKQLQASSTDSWTPTRYSIGCRRYCLILETHCRQTHQEGRFSSGRGSVSWHPQDLRNSNSEMGRGLLAFGVDQPCPMASITDCRSATRGVATHTHGNTTTAQAQPTLPQLRSPHGFGVLCRATTSSNDDGRQDHTSTWEQSRARFGNRRGLALQDLQGGTSTQPLSEAHGWRWVPIGEVVPDSCWLREDSADPRFKPYTRKMHRC